MSAAIQDAKGLLADAEKALRDLMQREIRAQRYTELAALAAIADGIVRLARGDGPRHINVSHPLAEISAPSSATDSPPLRKDFGTSRKAATPRYPRFERDEDKLIKIGWSKKSREEYEHRAPRGAVEAFARHLLAQTKAGKTFAVEDLLPIPDNSGEDLPSYQVYLILAWLCQSGGVVKKGRDGYIASDLLLHDGSLAALWAELSERSA